MTPLLCMTIHYKRCAILEGGKNFSKKACPNWAHAVIRGVHGTWSVPYHTTPLSKCGYGILFLLKPVVFTYRFETGTQPICYWFWAFSHLLNSQLNSAETSTQQSFTKNKTQLSKNHLISPLPTLPPPHQKTHHLIFSFSLFRFQSHHHQTHVIFFSHEVYNHRWHQSPQQWTNLQFISKVSYACYDSSQIAPNQVMFIGIAFNSTILDDENRNIMWNSGIEPRSKRIR